MSALISLQSESLYEPPKSIWKPRVIIATVGMLVSGTLNTLTFKFQNQRDFRHGLIQTSLMSMGE